MKTVSRLSAFILGAAVLLSGCDNSVPAETSSVTEEITTTAATTAAVSEITAATAETTAAPIELKAPPKEVTKTFGIRTEYRNSGNENESPRSPFDHFYYAADSEVYYPEFAAPMETFMTELRSNEMCADAVGLIEPYADGDVLIPFMLRSLPYTGLCHIFDAKPVGGCYKLGGEYLLYISDPENVTLYRKDPHWTECRRGIELLWANYDILKPLSVTAVYDAETAEEMAQAQVKMNHCWLEISASAETIEAVKKAFDDNGTDKYCFEYVVDPDAADVSPDYTSSSADNWELPDFVKPESWQELYTFDEALEHIDEIKKYGQTDYSEQMIVRLMNRNNIAFHTEIVSGIFDVEHGGENSPDNLYKATSPYFDSLDSIGEFLRDTYTSETADLWIYGSEDRKPPYIEKDDGLYLDAMNAPVWNDDPFEGRTYIEVIGSDSRKITFNWHYISWELFGFDNKDRKVWTPHHLQMQFTAVKENGEWRLPMIIFDNPEFEKKAQTIDEDRLNDAISQLVNDDLYNRPDGETVLYGDDAWQLVKERCEIDFPLPDKILNGPKYLPGIERSQYCHDLYYDGTGFYSNSYYDARAIVSGIVRYIGRIDGLNSENENVIILDENGHYWLYFQLDLDLNVKVGDTVEQFDVIGQTGSPGLYETIRYAFRVV